MTTTEPEVPDSPVEAENETKPYEPPRIVWREPFEPISFGVSCAKQPGNPGCIPGPTQG